MGIVSDAIHNSADEFTVVLSSSGVYYPSLNFSSLKNGVESKAFSSNIFFKTKVHYKHKIKYKAQQHWRKIGECLGFTFYIYITVSASPVHQTVN